MGELAIMFIMIMLISIISIFILILSKNKSNDIKIYLIYIYGVFLGWIVYTSCPSNYIVERLIGVIFIMIPIISLTIKNKNFQLSKILLLVSIIGSTSVLFFL